MRILIVDDEIAVANLLAESVRLQGHEAIVAYSGQEGLDRIAERRPDAVFLDLLMSGLSGVEVLRRIRQTDPALPVIVITGLGSAPEIEEAKRLGVTEILEKPSVLKHLNYALAALRAESP